MKFIYFILLISCFGCATKNINYDRNKIIEKYNDDYRFFLNDEEIVFENVFLNKNNIDQIIVDKRSKIVKINQKFKSNLFKLKEQNLDNFVNESFEIKDLDCQNCPVIIEGSIYSNRKINDFYFEENLIFDIRILKEASYNIMPLVIILNK